MTAELPRPHVETRGRSNASASRRRVIDTAGAGSSATVGSVIAERGGGSDAARDDKGGVR